MDDSGRDGDGLPRPKLRVVSETTAEEAARRDLQRVREDALAEIEWPLVDLAANMLRVVRGAGKPWEIGQQCAEVISAFTAYREAVGCYPSSDEIAQAVRFQADPEIMERLSAESRAMQDARDRMVRGGLQIAASTLLGQRPQQAAGEDELMKGATDHENALEALRERYRREHPPTFTSRAGRKPAGRPRRKS